MDIRKLGARIREERKNLKLSQEQLAESVGISDGYLGHIERGDRGLNLKNLVDIANHLGVSVDYLLADSLSLNDDIIARQIIQTLQNRSSEDKMKALNVIKAMFAD